MPTPFEDLNTAVKAMLANVNTAASHAVTQAPSNYGTDFRVPSAAAVYQIQIQPLEDYSRATVNYPRVVVTVLIHYFAASLANEETFLFATMNHAADELLVRSKWQAQPGIFDLEPAIDTEISEGSREGNVLSFEISATVLMDAV